MVYVDIIVQQEHSESTDLFGQGSSLPPTLTGRDLESLHSDSNHINNLINCSFYHCRAILKISSKSTRNLLSNGRISDWTISIVNRIATKI